MRSQEVILSLLRSYKFSWGHLRSTKVTWGRLRSQNGTVLTEADVTPNNILSKKWCLTPAFIEFIQKANSGQNIAETLKSGGKKFKIRYFGRSWIKRIFDVKKIAMSLSQILEHDPPIYFFLNLGNIGHFFACLNKM